jgi:electron transport complex protein RnfB
MAEPHPDDKQTKSSLEDILRLLPQTQCQLCDYAGCRPYATAMLEGEAPINRCLPGGTHTLANLGAALGIDHTPMLADMAQKSKPTQTVRIQEDACIGCTKCIQACPVDAILGRSKHMHSVIQDECSGCELCIPACPVDCIELVPQAELTASQKIARASQYRQRFEAREARLLAQQKATKKPQHTASKTERLNDIQAILQRQKNKHA